MFFNKSEVVEFFVERLKNGVMVITTLILNHLQKYSSLLFKVFCCLKVKKSTEGAPGY